MSEGRAFARAALAGNPSDGYGGAVLAVCVRDFAARATVTPDAARSVEPPAARALVEAACGRFSRVTGLPANVCVRIATTIPREVGLAGSSAIVIATLRALLAHHERTLDPETLAYTALAAEHDDLGIAAGPQDRLTQAFEGLVAMDFAAHTVERLDPALLPPLYLAYRRDAAGPSGVTHAALRARGDAVADGMRALAEQARAAWSALRSGDGDAFARAVDRSYDLRDAMIVLDERLRAMVRHARAHGCSANFAGSGGAIVGTYPDERAYADLRAALGADGCVTLRPTVR